jgi:hypothetical protein
LNRARSRVRNGAVTAILLFLTLFSTETRNAPAKRPVTPRRLTACAVVSRADVEQAIGRPVDAGSEEMAPAASTCDYEGSGGLVTITVQQLASKPDLAVEMASLRKEIPEGAARPASGLEDAFFFDIPGVGSQLHVLTGARQHLMVSVCGFGEPARAAVAAERIARKAIGRL